MKKLQKKFNVFDLLIAISIAGLVIVIGLVLWGQKRNLGERSALTVQVTENAPLILKEAKKGEAVYLNGQAAESQIKEVQKKENTIEITITGLGVINNGYVFNGQRILIGQKAELRGTFFARGIITGFTIDENR